MALFPFSEPRSKPKRAGRRASRPFFCARDFVFLLTLLCLAQPGFAATPASVPAPVPAATPVDEVESLIAAGVWHLALGVLEQQQGDIAADPEGWVRQERQRIRIYRATGDWPALIARLRKLPPVVPLDFYIEARTELAAALIRERQGRAALRVLRDLIWTQAGTVADAGARLRQWRRMVIDAYRAAGLGQDAWRAAIRLRHDYPDPELADVLRHARILLELDRSGEAADRLAAVRDNPRAATLYALARLRSGAQSPAEVMQAGLRRLRAAGEADERQRAELWALVAEAAGRGGDRATRANALEHVLAAPETARPESGLFAFDADSLWDAYLDYAESIGNQSRFLIGADAQWRAAAQAAAQKNLPVRSRSLYGLLIFQGGEAAGREQALRDFMQSMEKRKRGRTLLLRLFLESKRFPQQADIPLPARHQLADIALAQGDLTLASALMATVAKPPPGADQFFWYLRRARILILGGKGEQGAAALEEMLRAQPDLDDTRLDRLMQVIFDLQAQDLHVPAIRLLESLRARTPDVKRRREIYYWIADSEKALQRYRAAARHYFRSATLTDPAAMDPWAQTARYQAAVALAQAGLIADARRVYRRLLKLTRDEARRAVLQRELRKLRFRQQRQPGSIDPAQ